MNASFAVLEARVDAAVVDRLANRLVVAGALSFVAIFDDAGRDGLEGLVETTDPRLSAVRDDIVAQLTYGAVLTVVHPVTLATKAYELVRSVPDGAGFHVLCLREA